MIKNIIFDYYSKSLNSYINIYNKIMALRKKRDILHYPQLDTILMVEEFIRKHSGEFKKRVLWESLPKSMMYQTFCIIIDYLSESGKIAFDKEGKIAWLWNPKLVKKYLDRPDLKAR